MKSFRKFFTSAVEDELTECRRTLYVVEERSINEKFEYLSRRYSNIKFHKGLNPIGDGIVGWHFRVLGNAKLPLYLKIFIQSGIYIYDEFQKLFLSFKRNTKNTRTEGSRNNKSNEDSSFCQSI